MALHLSGGPSFDRGRSLSTRMVHKVRRRKNLEKVVTQERSRMAERWRDGVPFEVAVNISRPLYSGHGLISNGTPLCSA